MEVMRRVGLVSLMIILAAVMIAVSTLTSTAQSSGGQDNDEAAQYEPEDAPPAPDGDGVLYCTPGWLREWDQSQEWWYF